MMDNGIERRIEELRHGLQMYCNWYDGVCSNTEYYNDKYDDFRNAAEGIMNILDWICGKEYYYAGCDFDCKEDIEGLLSQIL